MKKIALFLILFSATLLHAEEYTILFNDGIEDETSWITSATDNCVTDILRTNVSRSKTEGYGLKCGTEAKIGKVELILNAEYSISSMTVYTAAYGGKNKDSIHAILVCGDTLKWQRGKATQIIPYTFTNAITTDTITICSSTTSNNRFYLHQIVFTAPDPLPNSAKLNTPLSVDMGSAILIDGQPATDSKNISISARSTSNDSLVLKLRNGKVFSLSSTSLPHTGGDINISYTVTSASDKGYTISDSLIVTAVGLDNIPVRKAIPVSVFAKNYTAPILPVDSSCMRIGHMPGNYYQPAQGLQDSALKSALSEVIHCGPRYRYGSGRLHTWNGFFFTDRDTLTHQVLDMYSNNIRYFDPEDTCSSVTDFDIEHMLPKSWWGSDVNEAYCDLFHLVPADYSANRSKSNNAPGIPNDTTFDNGSFVTGKGKNYGLSRVFCPADEYKGDFARAYFYIVTCYDSLQWVTSGDAGKAMTNDSYLEFRPWLQDLLIQWHRQDPVSEKEKARAIEVNKIQGNRNPFIDYPELAEYIWGNKQGVAVNFYNLTQSFGDPYNDEPTALRFITISPDNQVVKLLNDNHVYILKDGEVYTLLGQ